ncbi:TRAP transporter small permease [Roseivivax sp. GX 12232]|uniref:TRAP transporter small permease subunit n=1 Tax=Roseivivax sp. GX 12232 TaxID=2900547 RepID=UPI001E4D43A4|nr:TRAP transporter small permease [Roseivivax sp. GX 12232]MCE0504044.1 TRAP transporter small permease [Roseivivax sp. GX 12232]
MPDKILATLRQANGVIAILIGVVLLACVAFVLADVLLRQIGASLGGTDEISGYVMAVATSWGMAYTLSEMGHVRIDLLRSRAGARGRAGFDLVSLAILASTVTLIAVKCWPVLERSLVNGSRANTPLETPLALVQLPWFAGWIWFAVSAWATLLAAGALVMRGDFAGSDAAIGTFGEAEQAR